MPESRIRRKRASTPPSSPTAGPAGGAAPGRGGEPSAAGSGRKAGAGTVVSDGAAGSRGSSGSTGGELGQDAKRPRKPVRTGPKPTPRWWVPVMLGLMIAGLLWIVTFYLSGFRQYPVPPIGAWNLAAGFALIIAGFAMTTRWR